MQVDFAYYTRGVRQPQDPINARGDRGDSLPRRQLRLDRVLEEPGADLMAEACEHFQLHELAVEDASIAHQRPKVEKATTVSI